MKRRAGLAGTWYPDDVQACRAEILALAPQQTPPTGALRGLIAPHAGWRYCGEALGAAYQALAKARHDVELAVIFGSHRGADGPNTIFLAEAWETPLGDLTNDQARAHALRDALGLDEEPVAPRRYDNAVELHLPFVRLMFPRARLLMLGVAAAEVALDLGRRVGEACADADAVFLGSTDLTHYGPDYGFTPEGALPGARGWMRANDERFLRALLEADSAGALRLGVEESSACCPGAAVAAVEAARAGGQTLAPKLLSHYTSYDVAPSANAVGYAGLVL